MENVFAQIGAEISTDASSEEPFVKPKRCAFVFISAESGSCKCALENLKKIDAVKEVYLAKGAYELVAKVNGDSLDQLREIIGRQIRTLNGIKSTLTLTVV